jgi:hypothetical protein
LIVANLVGVAVLLFVGWSRLPPGTPATDAAEQQVRQRLTGAQETAPDLPPDYVAALVVTEYVAGHVSRMIYNYLIERGEPTPGGASEAEIAEKALVSGAGICGAATATARTLYERLGVEARSIQAFYRQPDGTLGGHITTEVYYDDGWHWFDPMWGAFFRDGDVLPLVDVVRLTPDEQAASLVYAASTAFMQVEGPGPEFVAYPELSVVLDGESIYARPAPRPGSPR